MGDDTRYWGTVATEFQRANRQGLFRQHADAVAQRLVLRWLPPAARGRVLKTDLFDEALGAGLDAALESRARTVVGMDLAREVARAATGRHPRLLGVCADVRRLPFADASFDAVVSTSTLDHFAARADIAESLRECLRVLAPGGTLVLTLDNPGNPVVALRNALPFRVVRWLGLVDYYVGATLGLQGGRRMLEALGFTVPEVDAVLHCPRGLALPLGAAMMHRSGAGLRAWYLRALMAFERLAGWPSRFVTGHFVAFRAVKPGPVR